ncbi:SCO3242 family prenyltransferase [Cellulomonas taurus]|uniref:SCO3242 family prenyltransferase n=1 Tax=Cellulomonas taurus TaxID=2729175 RepID=UPI001FEB5AE4|nr:UbiA family prenyltransferase [Cellulomonas taurus]
MTPTPHPTPTHPPAPGRQFPPRSAVRARGRQSATSDRAGTADLATVADYLELVRAPAVLTVLGDTVAGGSAAGHAWTPRRAVLPVASACLYSGGMALNDWADRELDAAERPERPIPSGRITPERALAVAGGLGVAGLALAAVGGGRRSLAVAVPLAAGVWLYDAVLKDSPAGPVAMAACRGLDVLMGAGVGRLRAAASAAATIAAHTAGVTWLSRGEVHGTSTGVAGAALATTATVAAATLLGPTIPAHLTSAAAPAQATGSGRARSAARRPATTPALAAAALATAAYLATVLPPQRAAVRTPGAAQARTATGAGIRAMIPLQAAWAARSGSPVAAALVGLVGVAGVALRRGRRTVSET